MFGFFRYKLRFVSVLGVLVAVFVFFVSCLLLPYYQGGDQVGYIAFYKSVGEYDFCEGLDFYKEMLGSREYGYYLLVYIFSDWVDKNLLISLLNSSLAFLAFRVVYQRGGAFSLLPLLISNFYFLVLLFSAERLKLALIVVLLAFSYGGIGRYVLYVSSLFTHVQVLLVLMGKYASVFWLDSKFLLSGKLKFRVIVVFAVGCFSSWVIVFFLGTHVLEKYQAYSEMAEAGGGYSGGLVALVKPGLFLVLTIFYAKDKVEAFFVHIPLLIGSFLVGEERLVMFSYFVFMYYALGVNRGLNLGVLSTSLYFSVKGLLFLRGVLIYGDGFYVF